MYLLVESARLDLVIAIFTYMLMFFIISSPFQENAKYRKGLLPFILVGALDSLPLHHEALAYASREYVPDDIEERLAKVQRSPSDTSALAAARLRESIWSPKYVPFLLLITLGCTLLGLFPSFIRLWLCVCSLNHFVISSCSCMSLPNLRYLAATFPTKAADFYPHNMDKVQVHPFMADLRVAVNVS